jgi:hypothetical protein
MLMKNALRFPHHFGGDGRLVIDAFLQHGWNWAWLMGIRQPDAGFTVSRSASGYHPAILKMKFKLSS